MKASMYRIIIIAIVGSLVGPPLPCFCAPSEWVQWDVSSGGNGHWYKAVPGFSGLTWTVACQQAQAEGGYLATITSAAENAFVFSLVADDLRFWNGGNWSGPALGGFHPDGSHDRASGWCWVTGEPWTYSNWWYSQPDHGWPIEDRMSFYGGGYGGGGPGSMWNDLHRDNTNMGGYVIESTPLMETSSFQSTLVETLSGQQGVLENGAVSGDLTGTINFTSLELITIETGSFAGKGFSKGQFQATLEGATYTGDWNGLLFLKPDERKIYLKGATSGEISATVEGYLTESVPQSGIYDQYQATWKIGRIGNITTSVTINISGTISYQSSSEFPETDLYILQSSIDGTVSGHYAGSLSAVINHIRIADIDNPYFGEGFSIISYVSESGQGEGWTYDKVISPGVVKMKGLFDSPLFGIVSGTLDERTIPRTLFATIERIDLGLPPMADLEVKTWGPTRVSPGQTINLIVEYRNQGLTNAYDTVVVVQLPPEVNYVSSTNGGIYRWETHEVIWKLGTVSPKYTGNLSATSTVKWGLPWGTQLNYSGAIGTTSAEIDDYLTGVLPINISNIFEYIGYQPIEVVSWEYLTPEEFDNLLTDPEFKEMYDYAVELGFNYTNFTSAFILSNAMEFKTALMMSADSAKGVVFVIKSEIPEGGSTRWLLVKYDETTISIFDRENGLSYNFTTDSFEAWGDWSKASSCPPEACLINCTLKEIGLPIIGCTTPQLGPILIGRNCWICSSGKDPLDPDRVLDAPSRAEYCARCLFGIIALKVPGGGCSLLPLRIATEMFWCESKCRYEPWKYTCSPGATRERCERFVRYKVIYKCNAECVWKPIDKTDCIKDCPGAWCNEDVQAGTAHCVIPWDCNKKPPNTGSHTQAVAPARDPNRKLGPDGRVLPGDKLQYKVEYANEGEGIAFGVYFTDTLDEDLDESTLEIGPVVDVNTGVQIAPPGNYNPATRTITWFVGQVDPNQGGYADFSVNVKNNTPLGAEIINFATVYFPSVPEETRTNGVVSIVTPFGDIDQDGDVDFGDYAILANQWLQLPVVPSADIAPGGGDGIVDFWDLAVLADHWLEGTTP
jgi:uncharacterized repeat protein (TIGR01451 family)